MPVFRARKKLAVFIPSLRGGGAERTMLRLANSIVEQGYAVDLVMAKAEGPYLAQVHPAVQVIDLDSVRVLRSLPGLVRYLRRHRPDSLLSVQNHANIVALWAHRLARVSTFIAVSEHNTLSVDASNDTSVGGRMIPMLAKVFYPWANTIISPSQGVANDLAQTLKLPKNKIQVIYNPVITPALQEKLNEPPEHSWFGDQTPVILAAGRLAPQKDYPTLLRAYAQLRQQLDARLMIIGEGPERPALEQLVRELGLERDVALPGFVHNPFAYMNRAALYVLSSGWEGLPTVLIEALYCGTPIVSTDCPSGPREILADGRYGELVGVGDTDALARAMLKVLRSPASPPPDESWYPYQSGLVVEQYIQRLLQV